MNIYARQGSFPLRYSTRQLETDERAGRVMPEAPRYNFGQDF
jgi:hypothetical protein